jgi:hypothetical protein
VARSGGAGGGWRGAREALQLGETRFVRIFGFSSQVVREKGSGVRWWGWLDAYSVRSRHCGEKKRQATDLFFTGKLRGGCHGDASAALLAFPLAPPVLSAGRAGPGHVTELVWPA